MTTHAIMWWQCCIGSSFLYSISTHLAWSLHCTSVEKKNERARLRLNRQSKKKKNRARAPTNIYSPLCIYIYIYMRVCMYVSPRASVTVYAAPISCAKLVLGSVRMPQMTTKGTKP